MKRSHHLAYRVMQLGWRVRRPVTVGALVMLLRDRQILLVSQTYKPGWNLPGGGVKRGETLEEAVRREAMEEVGAAMGALELWGVYSSFPHGKSDHAAVFVCRDHAISGRTDHEIEALRWFDLDALPNDVSGGTRRRLDELRVGHGPGFGRW